jgi:hypothetical protein
MRLVGFWFLYLAAAVLLASPPIALMSPAAAMEFKHDFRSNILLPAAFHFFGPQVGKFAQLEPGCGLHVRLPAKRGQLDSGVGVHTRFTVAGDCEISLAYELVSVAKPLSGYGSGVIIYLEAGMPKEPPKGFAILGRVVDVKGNPQHLVWYRLSDDKDQPGGTLKHFPARGRSNGWLRLVRTGSSLAWYVAEEQEQRFRQLLAVEWTTADLQAVRFVAHSGGSPTSLDICLQQAIIRADRLPNPQTVTLRRTPPWLPWLLLFVSLLFVGLVGYGLWRQRRQAA